MRIHIILLAVSGAELGVGAKIGAGAGKVAGDGTGAEFGTGAGAEAGAGAGAGEDRFSFLCPLKRIHCVGPCSSQPCNSACTVNGLFHR